MVKQLVTADLFPLLAVQPVRGRLFTSEDDKPGVNSALIISYRVWQSWFGGDEAVIGRTVQVNSTPRTIIGVMPPGFYLLDRNTDLWDTVPTGNSELLEIMEFKRLAATLIRCVSCQFSSPFFGLHSAPALHWNWRTLPSATRSTS